MGNKTDKNKFFVYWIALDEDGNPDLKIELCMDQPMAKKKCDEKESLVKGVVENKDKKDAGYLKRQFKQKYIDQYVALMTKEEPVTETPIEVSNEGVVENAPQSETTAVLAKTNTAGEESISENSPKNEVELFDVFYHHIDKTGMKTYGVCNSPLSAELEEYERKGEIRINRGKKDSSKFREECEDSIEQINTSPKVMDFLGLSKKAREARKADTKTVTEKQTNTMKENGSFKKFNGEPMARNDYKQPVNPQPTSGRDYSREFDRLNNKITDMSNKYDSLSSRITDLKRSVDTIPQIVRFLTDAKQDYNANNRDSRDFINQKMSKVSDSVLEISDKLDPFKRNIDETKSAVESIEGELKEVKDQLTLKGMTLAKDIRPENADQKVIANAKRLIDRLVGDITDAALEYAMHRDIIEGAAQQEEARNIEETEKIAKAREDGRQEMLVEILEKVSDIDAFLADENNAIIRGILNNHGLKLDKKLAKGKKIMVASDEVQKYLSKVSGIQDAGEYIVEKSMYTIGKKTFAAVVTKVEDPKPETDLPADTVEDTDNKGEDKGEK